MSQDVIPARQREIYLSGAAGSLPRVPVHPERLQEAARRRLPREHYNYVAEGVGLDATARANRAAFDRWCIVPRFLRDVTGRDTSLDLFGHRYASPVLLCPIGVLQVAHPEADLAVARAAAATGVPMIFSNQASVPMETCAAAMGDSPRWFQLYWSKSNELVSSLVQRAEAVGCEALVVTLDTPLLGWRCDNLELGWLPFVRGMGLAQYTSDPVFQRLLDDPPPDEEPQPRRKLNLSSLRLLWDLARNYPGNPLENVRSGRAIASLKQFLRIYSRANLTWEDLAFLRGRTKLPILLKGILSPEDARLAVQHGMDGIIVSNHGGRQLDACVASLDALPGVVKAVEGKIPVLFDSGIRTGADAFVALALGATAVCLGRPYVWGLALAGADGVVEVLRNLLADFSLNMSLAGCRTLADLRPDMLQPR
ncbi:MAG: alpha-hydroxy-acid oxidizing protein [Candidatus Eremiobacterota bacterium]